MNLFPEKLSLVIVIRALHGSEAAQDVIVNDRLGLRQISPVFGEKHFHVLVLQRRAYACDAEASES